MHSATSSNEPSLYISFISVVPIYLTISLTTLGTKMLRWSDSQSLGAPQHPVEMVQYLIEDAEPQILSFYIILTGCQELSSVVFGRFAHWTSVSFCNVRLSSSIVFGRLRRIRVFPSNVLEWKPLRLYSIEFGRCEVRTAHLSIND
jgi:hypothetical protein